MRPKFSTREELMIAAFRDGGSRRNRHASEIFAIIAGSMLFGIGMRDRIDKLLVFGALLPVWRLVKNMSGGCGAMNTIKMIIEKYEAACAESGDPATPPGDDKPSH